MGASHREFYAEHVAETQRRWEAALEAEGFAAVAVHSGTPMYAFQDDYEYAFRPNPHFLAWLPLTHHADSLLLVLPGVVALLAGRGGADRRSGGARF